MVLFMCASPSSRHSISFRVQVLPHVAPLFFWVSRDNLPNKKSTTFPAWANCLYLWEAAGHVHGDCCQPAYFADNNPKTFNGPLTHAIGALPNLNTEIL